MLRRLTFLLALFGGACAFGVFAYLAFIGVEMGDGQTHRIPSGAMEPTILIGDRITSRPLPRGVDALPVVARGMLVVHQFPPDTSKWFVKRLVGLPGDTLAMVNGVLQVNGRPVAEPYAWHAEPAEDPGFEEFAWMRRIQVRRPGGDTVAHPITRNNWGPLAIPANRYFVLGDNRDNSLDSRFWGLLEPQHLVARPLRVYYSADPESGRIRWARLAHGLQ